VRARFGYSVEWRTDGGSHNVNETTAEYCRRYGIKHSVTLAYHSQSLGGAERVIGTTRRMLQLATGAKSKYWAQHVDEVVELYNTQWHESIGCSPFKAMHGYDKRTHLVAALESTDNRRMGRPEWAEVLAQVRERVRIMDERAAVARKAEYDARVRPKTFAVGDTVLRYKPQVEDNMGLRYGGPYVVEAVMSERNACRVKNLNLGSAHDVHIDHLRHLDMSRSTVSDEIERELPDAYLIVDKILEHRVKDGGVYEFKVQWKQNRYLDWSESWEPAEGLKKVEAFQANLADNRIVLPRPQPRVADGRRKRRVRT